MKKYLIIAITFIIIAFTNITNVSATSITSQSRDVTVGEVDEIDTNDEDTYVHVPETGIFGLDAKNATIAAATFLTVPIVAIFAYVGLKSKS